MRINDLTGRRFGRLYVLQRDLSKTNKVHWLCRCDCGNTISVASGNLVSGNTTSCGCKKVDVGKGKLNDLTGKRFGRWTVLYRDETKQIGNASWICKCDCGTIKSVHGNNLVRGKTTSCGCYRAENPNHVNDLQGKRFGRLVALYVSVEQKDSNRWWVCQCDCGNKVTVRSVCLLRGDTTSCGCYQKERAGEYRFIDLTGKRFGKLVVIERAKGVFNHAYWKCQCDCGNIVEAVDGYNLTNGYSQSCGCLDISHGEKNILEYLEKRGFVAGKDFRTHVTFDDLLGVGNMHLSYDIELLGENHCLIEYQGKQHYEAISFFGGDEQLEIQREHDRRKKEYAETHNIKLWEISYKYDTYEKIAQYMDMILHEKSSVQK